MATRNFIRKKTPLETEAIDLSHIQDNTSLTTRFLLPPDVRLKSGQSQWVRVNVRVAKNRS